MIDRIYLPVTDLKRSETFYGGCSARSVSPSAGTSTRRPAIPILRALASRAFGDKLAATNKCS
jgi:hypothetical protein